MLSRSPTHCLSGSCEVGCGSHIDSFGVEVRRQGEARIVDTTTGRQNTSVTFDRAVQVVAFSPDGHSILAAGFDNIAHVIAASSGKEISRMEFKDAVSSAAFSQDARFAAAGSMDGTAVIFETASGKEIYRFSNASREDAVQSIQFSPNGRSLAITGGNSKNMSGTVAVVDCSWSGLQDEACAAWRSALRVQSGVQFTDNGRLVMLSASELIAEQTKVDSFLSSKPKPVESWQHEVLAWSRIAPDERTTTAGSGSLFCISMGRQLIRTTPSNLWQSMELWASEAPWHPLEPVSLARLEPKPKAGGDDAAREALMPRPRFLAQLTLKRLRAADVKIYDRDTLAQYGAWAAQIMHEELSLNTEALEAVNFALERTAPEMQKQLLELRAKLSARPSGKLPSGD